MSPKPSRRSVLSTGSVALATALAGCSGLTGQGSGDPGSASGTGGQDGTTYGFEVRNDLTSDDFDLSQEVDLEPAVIHLRVGNMDPETDEPYFERTLELDPDSSETVSGAFTAATDGPTYAVSAEFERFVEGGLSKDRHRKAGLTFSQGGFGTPGSNPIPVVLRNIENQELYPSITIESA
jgi:hypothetical protein